MTKEVMLDGQTQEQEQGQTEQVVMEPIPQGQEGGHRSISRCSKDPQAGAQTPLQVIFWGAFFLLAPGMVGAIASGLASHYFGVRPDGLVSMSLRFGGVWLALLLYLAWIDKRGPASIGLVPFSRKTGYAHPAAYAVLAFLVAGGLVSWGAAWAMVGRFIQAGAEEAVCRGYLLHRMTERRGVQMGIIANSLVFVVFHAPGFNPLAILALTLFGVLMSLLAIRSGHIWWCVCVHAVWNWSISLIF